MIKTPKSKSEALETPRKGRGGPPLGSQNARKHGHSLRKREIKELGFAAFTDSLDRRTEYAKALLAKRERTFYDLGGKESLSEMEVDQVGNRTAVFSLIESNLAWIF